MNMFYIVTLIYCVSGREKRLPVMAASSVPPFPWIDRMIGQAVIICRSTSTRSSHSSLLQEVTVSQLTQLLTDMRQRYVRICELADQPRTICFSPRYRRIFMSPEDAAQHILVCYSSYSTSQYSCYPTIAFW